MSSDTGSGFDHTGAVKNDANKTDQTQDDTVVVGQKVQAKINWDPVFNLNITDLQWSEPTGGGFVKGYVTNDNEGTILYHHASEYNQVLQFDYYYTNKTSVVGAIGCSGVKMIDPHGFQHSNVSAGSSFYLEAAHATTFDAPNDSIYFVYEWDTVTEGGSRVEVLGDSPQQMLAVGLLAWAARAEAPIYGGGEIAFTQLVTTSQTRNVALPVKNSNGQPALDGSHIYGTLTNAPAIATIQAEQKQILGTNDAPETHLFPAVIGAATTYSRDDDYVFYLIYKPNGNSIWVTLASCTWGWAGNVTKGAGGWTLDAGTGQTTNPVYNQPDSTLPTWDTNVNSLAWKQG